MQESPVKHDHCKRGRWETSWCEDAPHQLGMILCECFQYPIKSFWRNYPEKHRTIHKNKSILKNMKKKDIEY